MEFTRPLTDLDSSEPPRRFWRCNVPGCRRQAVGGIALVPYCWLHHCGAFRVDGGLCRRGVPAGGVCSQHRAGR